MDLLHQIEDFFLIFAQIGEVILEGIAVLCVLMGLALTLQLVWRVLRRNAFRRYIFDFPFIEIRLKFGLWLALALEFQLGADVLNTTIAPTTQALLRLAVIAVIRTFLNYFLHKEIEEELEMREKLQPEPIATPTSSEPPRG